MDAFTPAQTTELVSRIGAKKARMRLDKMIVSALLGSFLLGFGCTINVTTASSPWFQKNAPGLIRTVAASFFPVGLIMVFLTGADLFTSYCMYSVVAVLHRRIGVLDLAKTWAVSYLSNLAAMLFFVIVLVGYGGIFQSEPFKSQAISIATAKVVTPGWHQVFLRGILANWLVTMGVFLSVSSREMISKIVAIWFPTMCFTAIGADHVIANMFYIPLGIFSGAPVSVGLYIWKSMIPSALGNIVGGGLFVGVVYSYMYLDGPEVSLPFDSLPLGMTTPDSTLINVDGVLRSASLSGLAKELHVVHFQKDSHDQNRNGQV